MNHHSERVWSLGVGRGAVCVCGWWGWGVVDMPSYNGSVLRAQKKSGI